MVGVGCHNSGLTVDDSVGFVEQEETSSLDSIEWTDEKHNLYLKSMEASFVNHLYNLKDLFSWCPLRQGSPPPGSDQYEVHQHSYCRKKKYGTAPQPEEVDLCGTFLANPWIKHFRGGRLDVATDNCACEHQPLGYNGRKLSSCGSRNISRLFTGGGHHQVSLNLNEEFSDQNFVDEDCEDRAASGKKAKRLRTLNSSAEIGNDQVVPFGISQDSNKGCSGSQGRMIKRGGKAAKTESPF